MLRVAQILEETGFVQAVVRPSGQMEAPAGMIFIEIGDDVPDPCGKYYVDGEFQDEIPA